MIIRELTPEEWPLLEAHPALEGFGLPDPSTSKIVVAIDELGEIQAFWVILQVVHCEPAWIAPAYRSTTLLAKLWRGVRETLASCGVPVAFCFSDRSEIADYLGRLGFQELAFRTFLYLDPSCPSQSSPLSPAEPASSETG